MNPTPLGRNKKGQFMKPPPAKAAVHGRFIWLLPVALSALVVAIMLVNWNSPSASGPEAAAATAKASAPSTDSTGDTLGDPSAGAETTRTDPPSNRAADDDTGLYILLAIVAIIVVVGGGALFVFLLPILIPIGILAIAIALGIMLAHAL